MLKQEYDKYTEEDHDVWAHLFNEQMSHLPEKMTADYFKGIEIVGFKKNLVPRFDVINAGLQTSTGWQVYVVPGLIDNKPFFQHLANKEFPATTWLRKRSQLNYIEEPDMFHDVFGHVPLLSVPRFCDYLQAISALTLKHIDNPNVVEVAARLYWYTVEFGLIREKGELKIYGAGITSSPGESRYSLTEEATHLPYDVQTIFETPYVKDKFQEQYFIVDSYDELFDSLPEIEAAIERIVVEELFVEPSYA